MAFDNSNLKTDLCGGCDCSGFVPSVEFTYNAGAGTIAFEDNSTYGAGDGRKIVNILVDDKNGKKIAGSILEGDVDDAQTLDVSTLDLSEGFVARLTVVTIEGCISDGHAGRIGMLIVTGNVGSWDKDSSTKLTVGATDDES